MPCPMYLLDTSICVAILRGRHPHVAERFRDSMAAGIAVSSISVAELYFGVARSNHPERELAAVERLLGAVRTLSFGTEAARTFGVIRHYLESRGECIGQFDLMIAGHAVSERATLVTNNTREFSRVPTLVLDDWIT